MAGRLRDKATDYTDATQILGSGGRRSSGRFALTVPAEALSISCTDRSVGFSFVTSLRFILLPSRTEAQVNQGVTKVATVFYQNDANPSALKGKTIAVF